jgi:outer membrane protein assembly factor BamB
MTGRKGLRVLSFAILSLLILVTVGSAADWPMWRCNANRGAVTPLKLAPTLHLQWTRQYPKLDTAWPDQARMRFDKAYSPIVMGKLMFVVSSHSDSVRALNTDTGEQKWVFFADGPIRFAPAGYKGKLYVASDDGYLYCLKATTGQLVWKFRGGPMDKKVLGNHRLCSAWPVRGAPTVADGKVYFGASIWPFMGIFLYALDAETGKVVWSNDRLGAMYSMRPHRSQAFSGLAPQGYLAVVGDDLLVPNGRTTVARVNRKTGKLVYHHAARSGTYHLAAAGKFFFNAGVIHDIEKGRQLNIRSNYALALDATRIYTTSVYYIRAYPNTSMGLLEKKDRYKRSYHVADTSRLWRTSVPFFVSTLIRAGGHLYAGGRNAIRALELAGDNEPKPAWSKTVDGNVVELLAADNKLFAVTLDGKIMCYGPKKVRPKRYAMKTIRPALAGGAAASLLKATGTAGGYAVVLGVNDMKLVESLARDSKLHVIAIDNDAKKVDAGRKKLDAAGLYGHRAVVLHGDPLTYPLPPYLADLVVLTNMSAVNFAEKDRALVKQMKRIVRPYGGTVRTMRPIPPSSPPVAAIDAGAKLAGLSFVRQVGFTRKGGLPGAVNWTHQYADPANTAVGLDDLVKLPLGVLWFGGPANTEVLPRHGHGPSPQVADGRLIIEGADMIRAVDVYTGRMLWQRDLPGVGAAYDNTNHQPGANARGSNYVSLPDSVYVAFGTQCLRLDPATGKTLKAFRLPREKGAKRDSEWGVIVAYKNLLIAAADPMTPSYFFEEESLGKRRMGLGLDGSISQRIVVMDRFTGAVKWQAIAQHGFIHNSIIGAAGKVFCIDRPRLPRERLFGDKDLRGEGTIAGSRLLAFNAQTGKTEWSKNKNVFGTWLSCSEKYGVLLQAGRRSRDMVADEPDHRMILYRAKDGKVVWDKETGYNGPCMIHDGMILTQKKAYGLLTAKHRVSKHPMTGEDMLWGYTRNYGCGTARAGKHLLTFRSAAAGFLDLTNNGGTGNFGGFKSGCTSNLIPANGVLNAPDYTRTCACGYPNQSSLAMVHMPEAEMWTFNSIPWDGTPVRQLGVNLGAPGDRRDGNGLMWFEFPIVGGPSPILDIVAEPAAAKSFYKHSARLGGDGLRWVAASGLRGVGRLTIPLAKGAEDERSFTVRLHFSEPDGAKPGERLIRCNVQGAGMLEAIDIAREAGGADRPLVITFRGVKVVNDLVIELATSLDSKLTETVISGVEIAIE